MSQINQQGLDKLMDDIKTIKSTLDESGSLLRRLFLPAPLRLVGIIGGLSVIFFCLAFYFLNARYGSHAGIPVGIKYTLYCLLFADWILMAVLKNKKIIRSMKVVDPSYSLFDVFKYLHSGRMLHMYLPVVIIIFTLSGLAVYNNNLEHIIPILSIGVGIMYNYMGLILRIKEYLISGYWMILTGLLAAVFTSVSPLIDCSVSFGIGLLLFGLVRISPDETAKE